MKRYSLPLLAAMFVAGCSCAHRADRFQLDPGDDGGSTDGGMGDSSVPFDGSSDAGHDAGTECAEGESRPCPGGIDIGECNPGLQNCVDGQWGDCEGMISPADEICDELDKHTRGEEKAVYPVFADEVDGEKKIVEEGEDEHKEARQLIGQIRQTKDEDHLVELMTQLQQAVEHHVKEEETEMLPKARQGMEPTRLEQLADDFEAAKASVG